MERKNWQQYLYEVEERLTDCPRREKIRLLNGLAEEIEDYMNETPEDVFEDISEVFGQPEEVAQQLLNSVKLKKQWLTQSRKITALAVLFAILSALIFGMGYWIWIQSQEYAVVTTYESEPIEISDEEFNRLFEREP